MKDKETATTCYDDNLLAKKTRTVIEAIKGGMILLYDSKVFGMVLGRERVRRKMTQEQLSGLAGISRSYLAAMESGKRTPTLEMLWKLAEALDISPSAIALTVEKECMRRYEK